MKKLLLGLFGIIFGFINFSSSSFTVATQGNIISYNTENISQLYNTYGYGFLCLNSVPSDASIMIYDTNWVPLNTIQAQQVTQDFCFFIDGSASNIQVHTNNASNIQYDYIIAGGNAQCPSENEICPNIRLRIVNSNDNNQGTGLDLTNYNNGNILISDIYYSGNLQFSKSNGNLLMTCPSTDCSFFENELDMCLDDYDNLQSSLNSCESELNICTPALSQCLSGGGSDLTGLNWSALFINDIQHLGSAVINITIPEEIAWDYSGDLEEFNLDVIGYNVDSDYIQSVIDINSYRPTSEEFTDVFVSGLTFIFPYIVITLFIVFIRKLLKKIFK